MSERDGAAARRDVRGRSGRETTEIRGMKVLKKGNRGITPRYIIDRGLESRDEDVK